MTDMSQDRNASLPPLQAIADDVIYDRRAFRRAAKARVPPRPARRRILVDNGAWLNDTQARTLIVDGCSGSAYLMGLSRRLLSAHGIRSHAVGKGGSNKEELSRRMKGYLSRAEQEEIEELDMSDVSSALRISMSASQRHAESLLFETRARLESWEPSFEAMSSLFKRNVKCALVLRRNLLDWNICRVRDCLEADRIGVPVDAQGDRNEACLSRRIDPSKSTWALLEPKALVQKMSEDARERARLVKQLGEAELVREVLYTEDLLSFEQSSGGLGLSTESWMRLLKSWGLEPSKGIVEGVLSSEPLHGKLPEPSPHSQLIHNVEEVGSVLREHGLENYLRSP